MQAIDEEGETIRLRLFSNPLFELGQHFVKGDRSEVPRRSAETVAEGARLAPLSGGDRAIDLRNFPISLVDEHHDDQAAPTGTGDHEDAPASREAAGSEVGA